MNEHYGEVLDIYYSSGHSINRGDIVEFNDIWYIVVAKINSRAIGLLRVSTLSINPNIEIVVDIGKIVSIKRFVVASILTFKQYMDEIWTFIADIE